MLGQLVEGLTATLLAFSVGIAIVGVLRMRAGFRVTGLILVTLSLASLVFQGWASSNRWPGGTELLKVEYANVVTELAFSSVYLLIAIILVFGVVWSMRRRQSLDGTTTVALTAAVMLAGYVCAVVIGSVEGTVQRDPFERSILTIEGFSARVIYHGEIGPPTALCFDDSGNIYISDVDGRVWRGVQNADGEIEDVAVVLDGLDRPLGILWHAGELYVSSSGKIDAFRLSADGRSLGGRNLLDTLPTGIYSYHQNNAIVLGPDGRLYVGVGSTSDHDVESTPLAASILSLNTDGSDVRVFATGLRNPYGMAFDSQGQLWATDNGPAREYEIPPPDELNAITEGAHFGFPESYDTAWSGDADWSEPVATFPPHSSADGIVAYGQSLLGPEYVDNLFVVTWRNGDLYRIEVRPTGEAGRYLQRSAIFATGFLNPLAVAVDPAGRLLVADFGTRAIHAIEPDS